ncbi:MAG: DUF1080 domain-containing protein [Acidobacteriaceae bacterium]
MKIGKMLGVVLLVAAISGGCVFAQTGPSDADGSSATQSSVKPFLGRWDLTLKTPKGDAPSWLQLSQVDRVLKATMVGRWGGARPLPKVAINDGTLTFTSPKEEEASKTDLEFTAKLVHGRLVGSVNGPDGAAWTWTGQRAPAMVRTAPPQWGFPVNLFNGKNVDGWHEFSAGYFPVTGHWTVVNGTLVSPGNGPELVSDRKFGDFKLHLEFSCGAVSNSGVYLRGRYELQIENESADEPPSHHTGGIYGFLAPHPELPRTTGKWQTYDITLIGRRVTVVQDGKTIIHNKVIPGITGGALNSDEAAPGQIYLQGSEKGHVSFRDIVITPAE